MENAGAQTTAEPTIGRRYCGTALLLTLLMPGLGHVYAGRVRRGVALGVGGCLVGLVAAVVITYLPIERFNVIIGFGIIAAYWLTVLINAMVVTRKSSPQAPRKWYQHWAVYLGCFVGGLLFVVAFGHIERRIWIEGFTLPSSGMADTLIAGDRMFVDYAVYWFKPVERGDVVTFYAEGVIFVQRVIGLPGDTVEICNEQVILNGQPLHEPYAVFRGPIQHAYAPELLNTPLLTVPDGHIFVLGDNRRRSSDSRFRGTTPISDITGKARAIYWSRVPQPVVRNDVVLNDDPAIAGQKPGAFRWSRFGQIIH